MSRFTDICRWLLKYIVFAEKRYPIGPLFGGKLF